MEILAIILGFVGIVVGIVGIVVGAPSAIEFYTKLYGRLKKRYLSNPKASNSEAPMANEDADDGSKREDHDKS